MVLRKLLVKTVEEKIRVGSKSMSQSKIKVLHYVRICYYLM